MVIHRWFQGSSVCGGYRSGSLFNIYEEAPFGAPAAHCLFTQAVSDGLSLIGLQLLAGVVQRHFPTRAMCQRCEQSPSTRLIHFNNDPRTTREDINKILQSFSEENLL